MHRPGDEGEAGRSLVRAVSVPFAVTALAVLLLLLGLMSEAWAQYASVSPGYAQWEWARSPAGSMINGVVVRPDGYLIASLSHSWNGNSQPQYGLGDGYLHLIPPWGGAIDDGNRFGPKLRLGRMVIRRGRLYGAPVETDESRYHNGRVPLYELDMDTGAVIRITGWVASGTARALAVDPKTGDLLMPGYAQPDNDDVKWGYAPNIVAYNPETDTATVVLRDLPENARERWVVTNGDGSVLFLPNYPAAQVTSAAPPGSGGGGQAETSDLSIDAYDRSGPLLYQMRVPLVPNALAFGSQRCHAGKLYYATAFPQQPSDVNAIVPGPGAVSSPVAQASNADRYDGPASQSPLSDSTWDNDGNLVVATNNSVTVIGCPGYKPPTRPAAAGGGPPATQPQTRQPSGNTPSSANGPSPAGDVSQGVVAQKAGPIGSPALPAGPGAQAATQVQTQAQAQAGSGQAAYQAGIQGVSQGATAPNAVGLADVRVDSPALSFSASARRPELLPPWALSVTALSLTFLAVGAVVVSERSSAAGAFAPAGRNMR